MSVKNECRIKPAELRKTILKLRAENVSFWLTTHIEADLRQAREGREVFAAFLLLAVASLVAESVLGRRA